MSDNRVVSMANYTANGAYTDPATTLRDAADAIERGELKANKCFIVMVNTTDDQGGNDAFNITFYNAKMKCSEILAACEVMKARCLSMMGWLYGYDSNKK